MSEFKAERAAFKEAMTKITSKIRRGTKATFRGWALAVMGQFKMALASRFKTHTGKFKGSFAVRFSGRTEEDIDATFASTHKGARMHEYGDGRGGPKIITPRIKQWLAIPVQGSPAVQPSGGARYSTSLKDTVPKWAHLFFHQGKTSGVAWLLGKASRSKTAPVVAWYQLRKRVSITPRLRMREHIRSSIEKLRQEMAQAVNRG